MEYNITYGAKVSGAEVVTLALAKQNSNIEHSDTEAYLQLLLDAAVEDAENYTGTSLLQRNVIISFTDWATIYELPLAPIQSITSVKYLDADGAEQTVDTSGYTFYTKDGQHRLQIELDTFPVLDEDAPFPVTVTCVAGFATADMPAFVKSAVMMRFSHKELYREDMAIPTSMDRAFQNALRPIKRW